jgi:hypothetical protein
MGMAAIPGEVGEGFGHEGGTEVVFFGDRLDHVLKKGVAIGGDEGVGISPVHLKLTVGVFVIVLVGSPTEGQHDIANFGNHVKAAHEGLLVVAGFAGGIAGVRQLGAVGAQQEKFTLHPCFDAIAEGFGLAEDVLEDKARGLSEGLAFHEDVGGHPGDFGFPGELEEAGAIGEGEDIRVGGGHV